MNIRRIREDELPNLLRLYSFLHPEDPKIDPADDAVQKLWQKILADANLRYYVAHKEQKIVSTCTLTLVPNLTRGLRPYGLIENVVTDPEHRKQGYATQVLHTKLRYKVSF